MNNQLLEEDFSKRKTCTSCTASIAVESRFCIHCGSGQINPNAISAVKKWKIIKELAIFYGFFIAICCAAKFVDQFKTLGWSLCFDVVLAALAIVFFSIGWQNNKQVLKWPRFSFIKFCLYSGIAVIVSLVASFCTNWLNQTLFSQEVSYYWGFASSKYAIPLMIISVAVVPAVFEELAFRGYLLGQLSVVADANQAIFISSFLFSIIHLSFLSLFWMIPLALFLGFLRIKQQTIWYGVSVHFFFNVTVCVVELNEIYGSDIFSKIIQ